MLTILLCFWSFPIVPTLVMETSPSIVRILDVPPYNQFTLSCTVWAEALGEKIPLPLTIDWIKRVQLGSNVRFSPGCLSSAYILSINFYFQRRDNLRTVDKMLAPNVSITQRFQLMHSLEILSPMEYHVAIANTEAS